MRHYIYKTTCIPSGKYYYGVHSERRISDGYIGCGVFSNGTAARKSFRAMHKCDTAKDKLTPRYWACKDLWAGKGGSVKSSPKNRKGKY